jgi:hypothetical protein
MNIVEKIKLIYPQLWDKDFSQLGTIVVQDDSDGKGPYIAKWDHPTLTRPTEEQLA